MEMVILLGHVMNVDFQISSSCGITKEICGITSNNKIQNWVWDTQ